PAQPSENERAPGTRTAPATMDNRGGIVPQGNMNEGQQLIEACKQHILRTMRGMQECVPQTGRGAGNRQIELNAGFDLELAGHDGWFTWSLLTSLVQEGAIEIVPGTEKR